MPRRTAKKKNRNLDDAEDMELKDLFSLFKKLKRNVEKKAEERKEELKRKALENSKREISKKLRGCSRDQITKLTNIRKDILGLIETLTNIEKELRSVMQSSSSKSKSVSFEKRIRKEASEVTKKVQQKWEIRFGKKTKNLRHEEIKKRIHHFLRDLHDSLLRSKTGFETLRSELRRGVRKLSN